MKNISPQKRSELVETLRSAGVTNVCVSFDGSGDSGSIDHVGLYGADNKSVSVSQTIVYPFLHSEYNDGTWKYTTTEKEVPIAEALEQLCYDMLEETGIDWYNNDGGYGQLSIDIETGEVSLEVNTRYTEVNTYNFNQDCEEV